MLGEHMKETLTVLSPLLGVVIGALVAFLTAKLTIRQKEREQSAKVNIEKLESLHKEATKLKDAYRANMAGILYGNNLQSGSGGPIDKIQMLVSFYSPEAQDELDQLERSRRAYGEIIAGIYVDASHGDRESDFVKERMEQIPTLFKDIETCCDALQSKVVTLFQERMREIT